MRTIGAAAAVVPCLAGCAQSPSLSVLGAYFPDWMFCVITGVVCAIACHLILERAQPKFWIGPAAIVYPALTTLFALLAWLALFQH